MDLKTDPTFLSDDIAGVAIYVPLSTMLRDPLPSQYAGQSWSQLFDPNHPAFKSWNWGYLDAMLTLALRNKKHYSLAFVVGYQNMGTTKLGPQLADPYLQAAFPNAPRPFKVPSFEQSLPSWFEPLCNPGNTTSYYPLPLAAGGSPPPGSTASPWTPRSCAPTMNLWAVSQMCLSFKVPLPWNPNVQMFWIALGNAVSTHLRTTCFSGGQLGPCASGQSSVYSYLTLVHLPGLSVYDEELTFVGPTHHLPPKNGVTCPDGRTAQTTPSNGRDWATNSIAYDQSAYALTHNLGYQERPASAGRSATTNLIDGFETIAKGYAHAFPDRALGLSALNNINKIDLPDLSNSFAVGGEFHKIVRDLAEFLRESGSDALLEIQSDDLAGPSWNPHGPMANYTGCSTPTCVDPGIPWVNPQHFFPGLNAVYGWQSGGGFVILPGKTWAPVSQCMLAPVTGPNAFCVDSTAEADINESYYGMLKYAWAPVTVKGMPVQYLEIPPADAIMRPRSIRKAVKKGWFAPPHAERSGD